MSNALIPRIRAAVLGAVALLAACSHDQRATTADGTAGSSASQTAIYPVGIVPPPDWVSSKRAGIYSGETPTTCCFLAGTSTLVLDNPPGSQLAVFTFYVPSVDPLLKKPERVTVRFNGKPAAAPARLAPGMQDVSFPIPASLRQTRHLVASLEMSVRWVPKKIGLNDDLRELSIMLIRVGYI